MVQLQDVGVRGESSGEEEEPGGSVVGSGLGEMGTAPPPTTPCGPPPTQFPPPVHSPAVGEGGGARGGGGQGMSRSVSDTTLRKTALHLNLQQCSLLPSFTPLHQFKVGRAKVLRNQGRHEYFVTNRH